MKKHKNLLIGLAAAAAVAVAVWLFVIAPARKRKALETGFAPEPAPDGGNAAPARRVRNNTPRWPLEWLEFNPNTLVLQRRLNDYARRFNVPGKSVRPPVTAEDGFLGPDTLSLVRVWFPGIARDVDASKTLSREQWAIISTGPAVAPAQPKPVSLF